MCEIDFDIINNILRNLYLILFVEINEKKINYIFNYCK